MKRPPMCLSCAVSVTRACFCAQARADAGLLAATSCAEAELWVRRHRLLTRIPLDFAVLELGEPAERAHCPLLARHARRGIEHSRPQPSLILHHRLRERVHSDSNVTEAVRDSGDARGVRFLFAETLYRRGVSIRAHVRESCAVTQQCSRPSAFATGCHFPL